MEKLHFFFLSLKSFWCHNNLNYSYLLSLTFSTRRERGKERGNLGVENKNPTNKHLSLDKNAQVQKTRIYLNKHLMMIKTDIKNKTTGSIKLINIRRGCERTTIFFQCSMAVFQSEKKKNFRKKKGNA